MSDATAFVLLISATSYAVSSVAMLVFAVRHWRSPLRGLQLTLAVALGLGTALRIMTLFSLPGVAVVGAVNAIAAVTLTVFVLRAHRSLTIISASYEFALNTITASAAAQKAAQEREIAMAHTRAVEEFANAIPTLAWTARADGYIDWYNRQWYAYTGTTIDEMAGWGWTAAHEPDTLPVVLARWKDSIARGVPFEMTFPLRGRDGRFRHFLTRVVPAFESGRVVRWYGTNTDVEESQRAAATLAVLASNHPPQDDQ